MSDFNKTSLATTMNVFLVHNTGWLKCTRLCGAL